MPVFCRAQTLLALAILGEDSDGGHPWTHKNGSNGGEGAQYQRLVHHCNTTSPEDFTPPGDTEPRLSVSGCQAFVKNVLQWNLENLKKLKAVGVESGGGTVAEEDLTLSPEELEDLEQCCGDGTSEWYIAGETADAYREIFVAYKKWQAKATGAKEAAAQEKEQGANEARDQREQATQPGRQPSSPGTPAQGTSAQGTPQGTPSSGGNPRRRSRGTGGSGSGDGAGGGIDFNSINHLIKLRAQEYESEHSAEAREKRQKKEQDELEVRKLEAEARIAEAQAKKDEVASSKAQMQALMEMCASVISKK